MRDFTEVRSAGTEDEVWLVEHLPVFTLGQAGRREHLRLSGEVPVAQSDRGGQVTYHGPGQLVVYLLVDIRRARIGVKDFVHMLEDSVIEVLRSAGLRAARRPGAPGVYVDGAKIASLGLRVRRGCTLSWTRAQPVRRSGALFPNRSLWISGAGGYPARRPRFELDAGGGGRDSRSVPCRAPRPPGRSRPRRRRAELETRVPEHSLVRRSGWRRLEHDLRHFRPILVHQGVGRTEDFEDRDHAAPGRAVPIASVALQHREHAGQR